ncbi:hypothetical protein EJ04DRAFT_97009 [Polyplosphaeria fusca]|uniref:F-box domain-containing protein n=1 Tax=Polyplosphaeria fusca TaxID=682080 RepID=A0A9P4QL57_9PLEO|nr:hypothetical protein EJ04DRAFT_97009 [Polyplosphaeria fusca]
MSHSTSLIEMPPEIVACIIEQLPFDRQTVGELALVHSRLRYLLALYETSIAKGFSQRCLPHAPTDFPCDQYSYRWLVQCIGRYDVLDDIMAALTSDLSWFAVEPFNTALVYAGLLLMYRLPSFDTALEKLDFIKSLPRDSLIALFLAVHRSKQTARYFGHGYINQTRHGLLLDGNRLSLREDIEFCFVEGALNIGPKFIFDALRHEDEQETTLMCLYHDHATHDWDRTVDDGLDIPYTQGPHRNGMAKTRSLYTSLMERLSEFYGCGLHQLVDKIDTEVASHDHRLAWISLAEKTRLIQGLSLSRKPPHTVEGSTLTNP